MFIIVLEFVDMTLLLKHSQVSGWTWRNSVQELIVYLESLCLRSNKFKGEPRCVTSWMGQ